MSVGLGEVTSSSSRTYLSCSLCLEWNAMGMLDTSFGMFCEGLAVNATLQVLDIRNNQITHDGASELAAALKRNRALKSLGRWNA